MCVRAGACWESWIAKVRKVRCELCWRTDKDGREGTPGSRNGMSKGMATREPVVCLGKSCGWSTGCRGVGRGSGCASGSGSEGRLERLVSDPGSLGSRGQESVFSQRPGVSHASCPWFTLWESQAISRRPALRPLLQG